MKCQMLFSGVRGGGGREIRNYHLFVPGGGGGGGGG